MATPCDVAALGGNVWSSPTVFTTVFCEKYRLDSHRPCGTHASWGLTASGPLSSHVLKNTKAGYPTLVCSRVYVGSEGVRCVRHTSCHAATSHLRAPPSGFGYLTASGWRVWGPRLSVCKLFLCPETRSSPLQTQTTRRVVLAGHFHGLAGEREADGADNQIQTSPTF